MKYLTLALLVLLTACGGAQTEEEQEALGSAVSRLTGGLDAMTGRTVGPAATTGAAPRQLTSSQAIDAFTAAGLEVDSPRPMAQADYGSAPQVAAEGTRFLIPSREQDSGGRVMSFNSTEDLTTTKSFYDKLGDWTFVKNNLLVQMSASLPEETVQQYEAALQNIP